MTIAVFLQARMSSSRLPGKVLMPLAGKPMLLQQIERIQRVELVDNIIVCTSLDESDNAIAKFCETNKIACFRGSLDDVLDRFYQANNKIAAEHIVRLTGDCPLIDPDVVNDTIKLHLTNKNDYTTNCNPPTFPDGLDVEVMTKSTLIKCWQRATSSADREHVTLYIRNNPDQFLLGNYQGSIDLSGKRWTVDHPEDFQLVTNIYEALYFSTPKFTTEDVLTVLKQNPEWELINHDINRNEGLEKSLLADINSRDN